eukprot:TRINITY_DN8902_c1_g1_i1.p1 TRINITY_DN8902_c1_g1~~TRINITY_DN8902_c1_g1_i1.p1  ORF type:complete len:100 (+),score=9.29 TRINITY_DN8902_c1_g1_i1:282-581(+)
MWTSEDARGSRKRAHRPSLLALVGDNVARRSSQEVANTRTTRYKANRKRAQPFVACNGRRRRGMTQPTAQVANTRTARDEDDQDKSQTRAQRPSWHAFV